MKKTVGLVLILLLFMFGTSALGDVEINETNFPDAAFKSYVSERFGDGDGVLSIEEIESATIINVQGLGISSLTGIEFFSSLESLSCGYNNLTSLDLSKNTSLKSLECTCNFDLTSLDVSKNTELLWIWCDDANLTSLDVSNNIGESLSLTYVA